MRTAKRLACVFVALVMSWSVAKGAEEPTPEVQQAAMAFASEHHPQLAELLTRLKNDKHSEYAVAIRELHRDVERLQRFGKKERDRHDEELALWKVNSRLRLLTARMGMGGDESLEAEAKQLLKERHELTLATLKKERERMKTRLERIDLQIEKATVDAEATLQKELATLTKTSANSSFKNKNAATPKKKP